MNVRLSTVGGINEDLRDQVHRWWMIAAIKAGIKLTGFDPVASLPDRLSWARGKGLEIGAIFARQSSVARHAIATQARDNVEFAPSENIYTPPEYICVDVQSGLASDGDAWDRMREILKLNMIDVLLVDWPDRLYRSEYEAFAFAMMCVVAKDLRLVATRGDDAKIDESWPYWA